MYRTLILLLVILAPLSAVRGQAQDENARDIFLGSRREKTGSHKTETAKPRAKSSSQNVSIDSRRRPQTTAQITKKENSSGIMGLGYTLFLKNNVTQTFFRVSPGRIFNTGDSVRLLVESNTDGYLYLFHQEDGGPVKLLYPSSEIRDGDNRIWAHYPQFVPDPNIYEFTLTGKPAVENFTVVASSEPLPGVPIGSTLRGLNNVLIDRKLFRQITGFESYREYHSADGSSMTNRENSRDVLLVKSDPPPAHILVNRYSTGKRVVARFDVQHR